MAHSHEKIEYGLDEVKEVFDASVFTGTIIEVNNENDRADVEIDGLGRRDDVSIFYHCGEETTTEGGSYAFEEDDSVYILNKEGVVGPNASDLQIIGFTEGLKSCSFYINIKINGKVPEILKRLKIIDNNGVEHKAYSSIEEPDRVGPFENVKWPAKVYLFYIGGNWGMGVPTVQLFGYYAMSTTSDAYYLITEKDVCGSIGTPPDTEDIYKLTVRISHFPSSDPETQVRVKQIRWLLGETLSKAPDPEYVMEFNGLKLLGKLKTKTSSFYAGASCNDCDHAKVETKDWVSNKDEIVYTHAIVGGFPGDCGTSFPDQFCTSVCRMGFGSPRNCYQDRTGDLAIITDENGHNPIFTNARINIRFICGVICVQHEYTGASYYEGIPYYDYCDYDAPYTNPCWGGYDIEGDVYEWKMLPTPEDRI